MPESPFYGKYTYVLLHEPITGGSRADIHAVDRATLALTKITQQRYVYFGPENLEAAEQGGNVFFYARASSAASSADIYVFDQQSAAPATKLTSFSPNTSQQQIYALMPSADGTRVAFGLGAAAAICRVLKRTLIAVRPWHGQLRRPRRGTIPRCQVSVFA